MEYLSLFCTSGDVLLLAVQIQMVLVQLNVMIHITRQTGATQVISQKLDLRAFRSNFEEISGNRPPLCKAYMCWRLSFTSAAILSTESVLSPAAHLCIMPYRKEEEAAGGASSTLLYLLQSTMLQISSLPSFQKSN